MIIIHSFNAFPYAIPCAILMVTSAIIYNKNDKYTNFILIGMSLGIALIVFPIFIGDISETHHQIIIDENTSFTEVQQKYEIIGQKGISYIVKDIDT